MSGCWLSKGMRAALEWQASRLYAQSLPCSSFSRWVVFPPPPALLCNYFFVAVLRSMSSASPAFLMRLMASTFSIAEKAQTIVQQVMSGGDLGIVEKTGANDLQTKADRLVQISICSSLARKFPKLTIIGEEELPSQDIDESLIEAGQSEDVLKYSCPTQYSHIKEDEIVVWVDPLDGTKEYTEGLLDHVTVLIGIAYDGKAIAGVINQPYYNYQAGAGAVLGRTIWGILNLGVFGIQLKEVPEGKHIITTTRSHSSRLVNDCICAMNADEVIRVGGAGNKVLAEAT
ncbi:3'(2'),5'-bisphosphate nucleotidase 1 [Rhincodon typus]|uniref:3'(2'),5'-bisphosphate nucleotidase 1 n=1 Tax=Rhincodon typus TaxID=259920 RepID=UPI00202ECDD7|nr:3'(2'),5'-bisphosphate nucleotidase 1 [Rhincodon typus]